MTHDRYHVMFQKNRKVDTPVSHLAIGCHALAIQPKLPNQPPHIATYPPMGQARARRCHTAWKGSIAVLNHVHYLAATLAIGLLPPIATAAPPEIVSLKKIWDAGKHNAFTDLIRWH